MPSQAVEASSGRVRWIQEGDKELLLVDLNQATSEEALGALEAFQKSLFGRPPASVHLLMDLSQTHYSPSVSSRWKSAAKTANATVLKASAVYGATGIVGVALKGYLEALRLVGMGSDSIGVFRDRNQALAWLKTR